MRQVILCLLLPTFASAQEGDRAIVVTEGELSVTGLKNRYARDEHVELVVQVPRDNVVRARTEVLLTREGFVGAPLASELRDYDRYSDVQQLRFELRPPRAERKGALSLLVRVRGLRLDTAGSEVKPFEEKFTYRLVYPTAGDAALRAGQRLPGAVRFELDSAVVEPRFEKQLAKWAAALQAKTDLGSVVVEGHADRTGSQDYNLDLSKRRAEATRRALIRLGVPGRVMTVHALGFSKPYAGDVADDGSFDRRAEVVWYRK